MTYGGAYTQAMYDIEERTGKNIEDFLDESCFPDYEEDEQEYSGYEDYED